jgi:hypothetical protein
MAAGTRQRSSGLTAVEEIRSGGQIVDNAARMSQTPVLLVGGSAHVGRPGLVNAGSFKRLTMITKHLTTYTVFILRQD